MNVLVIIVGILGSVLTFYISEKFEQSAVRSRVANCRFILSFFPEIFNAYSSKYIHSFYRNFLYRNGFAKVQRSYFRLVAGILFSSIYINKSHFFEGFGGALGTLALFLYSQLYVFDFILRST
jgi:hypothetical protein